MLRVTELFIVYEIHIDFIKLEQYYSIAEGCQVYLLGSLSLVNWSAELPKNVYDPVVDFLVHCSV